MVGFNIYRRMTEEELRDVGQQLQIQITDFFEANPDRDDANAQIWYGRVHTFKRDNIAEQINALIEQTVEEDNKARATAPQDDSGDCCGGCDK